MTDVARDTCEEIMCATYRALCEHGYADVTMQDIADESPRSKAALHYHYDTKGDLMAAFLDHLYADFEARIEGVDEDDPYEHLLALLEEIFDEDDGDQEFRTAFLEIQAQAPFDDAFRERLREFDELLLAEFRDAVAAGVESGRFDAEVAPDRVASFLVTAIDGAHSRNVAVGHPVDETHEILRRYLRDTLSVDDAASPEVNAP